MVSLYKYFLGNMQMRLLKQKTKNTKVPLSGLSPPNILSQGPIHTSNSLLQVPQKAIIGSPFTESMCWPLKKKKTCQGSRNVCLKIIQQSWPDNGAHRRQGRDIQGPVHRPTGYLRTFYNGWWEQVHERRTVHVTIPKLWGNSPHSSLPQLLPCLLARLARLEARKDRQWGTEAALCVNRTTLVTFSFSSSLKFGHATIALARRTHKTFQSWEKSVWRWNLNELSV